MIEPIKDMVICLILFMLAPILGILLSVFVIVLWVGLPFWGVYQALKGPYRV